MTRWNPEPAAVRLWRHVERDANERGCWLWLGSLATNGYGQIKGDDGRRLVQVHRVSYEALVGPIPEGLQLDHLCRVRNCVNPEHLEPVTSRENVLRGVSPAAVNAKQTHCKNGHPLVEGNLYPETSGGRGTCRRCAIDRARKRRLRLQAEAAV